MILTYSYNGNTFMIINTNSVNKNYTSYVNSFYHNPVMLKLTKMNFNKFI